MPTQAERRAGTRAAVLRASVQVLVEAGTPGFTTPAVAARAGVAQGTVFVHFRTKAALLAATVDSAVRAAVDEHAEAFVTRLATDPPPDRSALVRRAVDALWGAFTDDRVLAATEARVRARTDEDLRRELGDSVQALHTTAADVVALLLPETFGVPGADYRDVAAIVVNAVQGRALATTYAPDPAADRELLDALVRVVDERYRTAGHVGVAAVEAAGVEAAGVESG